MAHSNRLAIALVLVGTPVVAANLVGLLPRQTREPRQEAGRAAEKIPGLSVITGRVVVVGKDFIAIQPDDPSRQRIELRTGEALLTMPAAISRGDRVTIDYVLQALKIE